MIQIGHCYATGEYNPEPEFKRHFRQAIPEVSKVVRVVEKRAIKPPIERITYPKGFPLVLKLVDKVEAPLKIRAKTVDKSILSMADMVTIRQIVLDITRTPIEGFMSDVKSEPITVIRMLYVGVIKRKDQRCQNRKIGLAMCRSHASVSRLLKQFIFMIRTDSTFLETYNLCLSEVEKIERK